jgi:hypothetical protein
MKLPVEQQPRLLVVSGHSPDTVYECHMLRLAKVEMVDEGHGLMPWGGMHRKISSLRNSAVLGGRAKSEMGDEEDCMQEEAVEPPVLSLRLLISSLQLLSAAILPSILETAIFGWW